MKKQKVMFQLKGQDKTTEKQLNEVEIGNLPEKFRIMIVKMIQDPRKNIFCRRCKKCLPKTYKNQSTNRDE